MTVTNFQKRKFNKKLEKLLCKHKIDSIDNDDFVVFTSKCLFESMDNFDRLLANIYLHKRVVTNIYIFFGTERFNSFINGNNVFKDMCLIKSSTLEKKIRYFVKNRLREKYFEEFKYLSYRLNGNF